MQIGDKVKVIAYNPDNDPDINPFPIGTVGTITNYRSMYDNPYQGRANGESWWYKEKDIKIV